MRNNLDNLDALRLDEGLVRNNHQTLEQIVEKMRTPIHEPVERENMENIGSRYMPLGISLD